MIETNAVSGVNHVPDLACVHVPVAHSLSDFLRGGAAVPRLCQMELENMKSGTRNNLRISESIGTINYDFG